MSNESYTYIRQNAIHIHERTSYICAESKSDDHLQRAIYIHKRAYIFLKEPYVSVQRMI